MAEDFNKRVALIEVKVDNTDAKKEVKSLTSDIIDQNDAVKKNTESIKDLEKENKALNGEVKKGSKSRKEANKELVANGKTIKDLKTKNVSLKDGIKDLNKERQSAIKVSKLEANSLDALRKKSVELKKDFNKQETATKKGREEFERLRKQLKTTNDQIKELDKGAGDFKTNIGDYPEALDNMTGGMASSTKGIGAMIKASLAFIATPLGAILGAVAFAVLAVKTAFESSEEGQNKFNKISAVIGVTIGNLSDLLADLGEFIIGVFEDPKQALEDFGNLIKQNVVNRFDGLMELIPQLGKAISQLFEGDFAGAAETAGNAVIKVATGIDDFTGKVREASKATSDFFTKTIEESNEAAKVADDRAKADLLSRSLLVDRAKIESEIAGLRLKSRQEDKFGAQERKDALIEAQKLEEILLTREKEVLKLRADAFTLENTFSRSTKENLDAEAQAIAEVSRVEARRLDQQRSTQRELNRLNKELAKEAGDKVKEEEKAQEDKLEVEATARTLRLETLSEELDARQDIIDAANERRLESEEQTQVAQKEIVKKGQKAVAGAFDIANNLVEKRYSDRFKNLEKQLANGQITEEEFAKKKEELEKKQALAEWDIKNKLFRIDQIQNIASAIANTAVGITRALASAPPPFNIALASITGAAGAIQLGAISTQQPPPKPSFAEGGTVISGKSHAQGGEDIYVGGRYAGEMEGGEGLFVTKKAATVAMIDDYNTGAGGRSMFGTSTRFAQEGGRIETEANSQITAQMIAEAMQLIPAPQVQVVDIQSGVEGNEEATNIAVI